MEEATAMDAQARKTIVEIVDRYKSDQHGKIQIRYILAILEDIVATGEGTESTLISSALRKEAEDFVESNPSLLMDDSDVVAFVEQMLSTSGQRSAWVDASSIMQADRSNTRDGAHHPGQSPLAQSTPTHSQLHKARSAVLSARFRERRSPSFPRSMTDSQLQTLAEGSTDSELPRSGSSVDVPTAATALDLTIATERYTSRIKALEEHERALQATVLDHEHQLQSLEERNEEAEAQLRSRTREVQELRAADAKVKQHISDLEHDLEATAQEASRAKEQLADAREELECERKESRHLDTAAGRLTTQVEELQTQLGERGSRLGRLHKEKDDLAAQLNNLQLEAERREETEARLADALRACDQWEEQVRQLNRDMDEMKKASVRRPAPDSVPGTLRSMEGVEATSGTEADHGPSGEKLQQQQLQDDAYLEGRRKLGREMQLQRTLIERLMLLSSKTQKQAGGRGRGGIDARAAGRPTTNEIAQLVQSVGIQRQRQSWTVIVLYSLVLLMVGFLAAQYLWPSGTRPLYGEYRAWERANELGPVFEPYGLRAGGYASRWWEGGPRLVQKAGFWLEERLLEGPWPS